MEELKTKLQEDDAREKAQAVKWDEVRDLLFGWEEELAPLQAQLPELKMLGWKPGMSPLEAMQQAAIQQAQMAFQQAQADYGMQADQYMLVAKQALEMGQQPPPEPPMPQPMPPAPVPYVNPAPLKPALQHVILWLWEDMLMREGMQVSPELRTYMGLRAVWEHYRKLGTAVAMRPAAPEMGAPPPAPGPAGPQPLAPQAVPQVPVAAWRNVRSLAATRASTPGRWFSGAYRKRCVDGGEKSLDCDLLRSLVVVETTMALEEIERARDHRGTAEALEALALDGEPEILIAGMRILGQFPDTPGIAETALPLLLESPYLQVQDLAARLLAQNPDPTLAAVGLYWGANHSTLYAEDAYQEYPDFAPHYADMDFPEYPDAEWFSPADSDRSVGWSTTDGFAPCRRGSPKNWAARAWTFGLGPSGCRRSRRPCSKSIRTNRPKCSG